MPRNYKSTAKFQKPDPRYGSMVATKLINYIMQDGKKAVAMDIFYEACDMASKKLEDIKPEDVFVKALENVRPAVEVRSKRVGGSNYQVPREVDPKRAQALAIRWLVGNARKKKGMPMAKRLSAEFVDACNNTGASVQWKDNVHKMAEANKAFSHFNF
ncbi:MAG: 30S ribosomal protein S7 [Planctomycetota bacterium]|nr:30S ribosomal protein S7 [Planctomycetota bacterium]MDA1112819.1 30S ribosomal protein S7 [Planctomycetota bacterium]